MSDSAHSAEIEDVLSSIRRLVAGEAMGRQPRTPAAQDAEPPAADPKAAPIAPESVSAAETPAADNLAKPALVLTPEDRVGGPETAPRDIESLKSQWDEDAEAEIARAEEPPKPITNAETSTHPETPVPLEEPNKRIPLLARQLLKTQATATPNPRDPQTDNSTSEEDVATARSDADEAPFDDQRDQDLPLETEPPVPMFLRSRETWPPDQPDQPGQISSSEPDEEESGDVVSHDNAPQTAPAPPVQADVPHSDAAEVQEPGHRRSGFAFGVGLPPIAGAGPAPPPTGAPGFDSGGRPLWASRPHEGDTAAPPDPESLSQSPKGATEQAAEPAPAVVTDDIEEQVDRAPQSQPSVFCMDEEDTDDDAALRALVSKVVIEELQGPLGERITRNVRKLVRREIQRALTMRDFE